MFRPSIPGCVVRGILQLATVLYCGYSIRRVDAKRMHVIPNIMYKSKTERMLLDCDEPWSL